MSAIDGHDVDCYVRCVEEMKEKNVRKVDVNGLKVDAINFMQGLLFISFISERKGTRRKVYGHNLKLLRYLVMDGGRVVFVYQNKENGIDTVKVKRSKEAACSTVNEETIISENVFQDEDFL